MTRQVGKRREEWGVERKGKMPSCLSAGVRPCEAKSGAEDLEIGTTFPTTGCPAVDQTTLIAHISLMPGPIIKPFDSMKVKTGNFFLVYDKSSYWLY